MIKNIGEEIIKEKNNIKNISNNLHKYFLVIIGCGLIGYILAIQYSKTLPEVYEAIAQIKIAQTTMYLNDFNQEDNYYLKINNIEDQNEIIQKFKIVTVYSEKEQNECKEDGKEFFEFF